MRLKRSSIVAGAMIAVFALAPSVAAAPVVNTAGLRAAVTATGVKAHLDAFQQIANANGGTRAAGTSGYTASVQYVKSQLQAAGYSVREQAFTYQLWNQVAAEMAQLTPTPTTYVFGTDFQLFQYSDSGSIAAARVTPAGGIVLPPTTVASSASGCTAADFAGFPAGNIALIQRGTCDFSVKVANAQAAGASAVIIFNEGNPSDPDRVGLIGGTLGADNDAALTIPAFDATDTLGQQLYAAATSASGLRMRLSATTTLTTTQTQNVLADTRSGRTDRLVVVGAHLDSVPEGPGINDNGSGSATVLEIALQMARLGIQPTNAVRFAFWGGEEDGLIGSTYYVSQLTARDIKNHALNLNLDMVGSTNFVRFVYDGDGSTFGVPGPNGSKVIEGVFNDYFRSQGLAVEATEFDGRSDYQAFINNGIPAGGLFTGAEGVKTAAQAATYGGTAGQPYDPCYHAACDTTSNVSMTALEQMSDAAAHATLTFAMTTSAVNGTDKGKAKGQFDDELDFRASFAVR